MLRIARGSVLIAASVFSISGLIAQVVTGTYPYGTFDVPGIDTINVGNLNVHMSLPVLQKTGRGMPFYYNLSFDSSVWSLSSVSGSSAWSPVQNFGWRGDTEAVVGYVSYNFDYNEITIPGSNGLTCIVNQYSDSIYPDTFGVSHSFGGNTQDPSQCFEEGYTKIKAFPSFTQTAADGSGYTMTVTDYFEAQLTSLSGKYIQPLGGPAGSGVATDPNGNEISSDGAGHFTDTTGNVVLTIAGSAPSPHTFVYTDTYGNPQTVKITYSTYTVQTAFGRSGVAECGPTSTSLVNQI